MEKSLLSKILAKLSFAIIAIAVVDLLYLNYLVIGRGNVQTEGRLITNTEVPGEVDPSPSPEATVSPSPPASGSEVKTIVEKETVVEKQTPSASSGQAETIVQTAQKEIFIPMGAGSTKSGSFSDLTTTDVTIDTSKYSSISSVVFEASIWVEGGNGAVYAQLYNVSDKTGYIESQITNNTGTAAAKTSGKIPIPTGQKTYRVQAKTDIVEFAAQVSNARLKITLK